MVKRAKAGKIHAQTKKVGIWAKKSTHFPASLPLPSWYQAQGRMQMQDSQPSLQFPTCCITTLLHLKYLRGQV